ncbi:MAG: TIGR03960 family B12-binding radical SAM protein [Actinomycetota bacterium]|nr:TIGR03960 family B12-binding radical SAM protein [Actinomycetota bacterium]
MKDDLQPLLPKVRRPGRYIGGELNQVVKKEAGVRIALAFPDVYEVGMSNLGLQILYEVINDLPDFGCERVFAPWPDMEAQMRQTRTPLTALESARPISEFDLIGFSLQYELTFTNVLNMIELAGLPLLAAERAGLPIVIAGGPCAFNPEPMALFFDAVFIGEAEEAIVEIMESVREFKEEHGRNADRNKLLAALSRIDGVYVPGLYSWTGGYPLVSQDGAPATVKRRVITDFDKAPIPKRPLVPFLETVHDRCVIEIMRGCTRGCRFCQAGVIYRPARERAAATIGAAAKTQIKNTGYEEISLASLSATDHSEITAALQEVREIGFSPAWRVSLPSMRTDKFSVEIAEKIAGARKTGLTFAPEAGTDRLRRVINKGLTEEDALNAAKKAFSSGWTRIKLYFMIGLPTETDEDVSAIALLINKILEAARLDLGAKAAKRLKIAVSVSSFVPKAHSPFQWATMITPKEIAGRQALLRGDLRSRQVELKWHEAASSQVEAALARGGREMAPVIAKAYELGARFDGWSDHFSFETWRRAGVEAGIDIDQAAKRKIEPDDALPWDHIDCGVTKAWLAKEYERSLDEIETVDCRSGSCSQCGVCKDGIKMEIRS